MSESESSIEADCKSLAYSLGWVAYKGHGRNGAPDHIFLKMGRGFTVEFKTKTGRQSDSQKQEQKVLERRGIPYYLVRTLMKFKDVLLSEEAKFSSEEQAIFEEVMK